ncbi:hypothetical protein [Thiomonas sp. FB-Cd]|uniref:hypothetical protein n=1 Tax=Thiomonas sp. FB-Cd TaxID=1158292 RepID=UPI00068D33CF|nr:hypothetical protein [Thiomonas sp. FB-Cd]
MNKNKDIQAVLLHGAVGLGIWEALYDAARAVLCEAPVAAASPQLGVSQDVGLKACGHCAACRLMAAGTHPDLMVLVPDALLPELGVGTQESTEVPVASEKRAPSKEIGIDAIRGLVVWAHGTSHRGGSKVAVIYPLDAMALPAANAMLKTLEEPPPGLYLYMGTHRQDRVLPTIRSRCRLMTMPRPGRAEAMQLLQSRELASAEQIADWCRNAVHDIEPQRGMEWARKMLAAVASGQGSVTAGEVGPVPVMPAAVAALQKISVDLMRVRLGLDPVYMPSEKAALQRLATMAEARPLQAFWQRLTTLSSTASFPLHAALASESLVLEFKQLFMRSTH